MYSELVKENAVLRRSAVVNQLYGGWKLAVEAKKLEEQPDAIKTRGDDGITGSATREQVG